MFQNDNEEGNLSRLSNESKEDDEGEIPVEEMLKKPKKEEEGNEQKI